MILSIESVIAAGEEINKPFISLYTAIIIAFLIVAVTGLLIELSKEKWSNGKRIALLNLSVLIALIFVAGVGLMYLNYANDVAAWQKESVEPYLEKSGGIKKPITSVEKNKDVYAVRYTNEENITEVLHIHEDADTFPRMIWDVKSNDEPYLEFYKLEKNIGHGVEKGAYSFSAHLHTKGKAE